MLTLKIAEQLIRHGSDKSLYQIYCSGSRGPGPATQPLYPTPVKTSKKKKKKRWSLQVSRVIRTSSHKFLDQLLADAVIPVSKLAKNTQLSLSDQYIKAHEVKYMSFSKMLTHKFQEKKLQWHYSFCVCRFRRDT